MKYFLLQLEGLSAAPDGLTYPQYGAFALRNNHIKQLGESLRYAQERSAATNQKAGTSSRISAWDDQALKVRGRGNQLIPVVGYLDPMSETSVALTKNAISFSPTERKGPKLFLLANKDSKQILRNLALQDEMARDEQCRADAYLTANIQTIQLRHNTAVGVNHLVYLDLYALDNKLSDLPGVYRGIGVSFPLSELLQLMEYTAEEIFTLRCRQFADLAQPAIS